MDTNPLLGFVTCSHARSEKENPRDHTTKKFRDKDREERVNHGGIELVKETCMRSYLDMVIGLEGGDNETNNFEGS